MRLQLILAFAVIILIVVGVSWLLAVQTTGNQFAVLISDNNQRQANYIAPMIASEYQELGSWDELQAGFDAQRQQVTSHPQTWEFRALPEEAVNALFETGPLVSRPALPIHEEGIDTIFETALPAQWRVPSTYTDVMIRPSPLMELSILANNQAGRTIIVQPSATSFLARDLWYGRQRAIIVDAGNRVVVDSQGELVGQSVDFNFIENGIPLYEGDNKIGTFVVTSRDGVYTLEQSDFLARVRQGLLTGGLLSGGLALGLAFWIAHRFTHPVRSLTAGVTQIQAGEWGYQVQSRVTGGTNEISRLSQAFNQMSQHLAEQRRLRARLVDDLAHELNTPLSLMHLELQGMRDGFQSPEEAADNLTQELDEVADLVADLIFLASRDTRRAPKMDWVDLNELIAHTIRRFEGSAGPNIDLKFLPQPNIPELYADGDLIQRAVSNLVSNAIRYTSNIGTVTLQTRSTGSYLEVIVQDTGDGIPAEHLPHIFDRFYRVDSSRSRQSGGSGLGLSIVKQIMDEHKGEVRVQSQPGVGSTFTLSWQIA